MSRLLLIPCVVLLSLVASCNHDDDDDTEQTSGFQSAANWAAFNAGSIGGLTTRGYFGSAFDGRYVYYVPCRNTDIHGFVMRYDTEQDFRAAGSWQSYDAGATEGLETKGYGGAVYQSGYVYFVPFTAGDRHARVLRFRTEGGFNDASSWNAHDAKAEAGSAAAGYCGGVSDGRYVYFAPYGYPPYAHGIALRVDTAGNFHSSGSWGVYNAGATDGMNTKGYYGMGFDGRYVYYAPFNDGSAYHGRVLRYDTQGDFRSQSSWSAYNAQGTDGMNTVGYKGVVYDGRYIYFVPFRDDDSDGHCRVLRLDTQGDFKDPASWRAFDASGTDGLDTRGYLGGCFDGRFVYFCPYSIGEQNYHGSFLRFDAQGAFTDGASWSAFQPGTVNGLTIKGYKGAVVAGNYIYYTPYHDGTAFSGTALRYKFQ